MEKVTCPYCGPTPVDHFAEWTGSLLARIFGPFNSLADLFLRTVSRTVSGVNLDFLLLSFLNFFVFIKVGGFIKTWNEPISHRTKVIWNEANKRGIDLKVFSFFGHPTDIIVARFGKRLLVFDALPRPKGKRSKALLWMDNKGYMRAHFLQAGLPVAKGGMFFLWSSAKKLFRKLDKPVIVKPSEGSRSRHTTININTEAELINAIKISKVLSPWIILEEQLQGRVYRATVIGGKVVGVMRRDPPEVEGDGVKTLRQLVEEENKNPKRHDGIFHVLQTGFEADEEIKRQGFTWDSILNKGVWVTLHPKVGRSSGATNADVTDITHPENIRLLERVATVLGESLVGIDFIIEDIRRPWREQKKSGIIECNSLPFIDLHHYPFDGEVRDAAGALWDIVLPQTRAGI